MRYVYGHGIRKSYLKRMFSLPQFNSNKKPFKIFQYISNVSFTRSTPRLYIHLCNAIFITHIMRLRFWRHIRHFELREWMKFLLFLWFERFSQRKQIYLLGPKGRLNSIAIFLSKNKIREKSELKSWKSENKKIWMHKKQFDVVAVQAFCVGERFGH